MRILLIGTAGLVAVFLISANLMLVTGLLALAAFAAILGGFILQPKGEFISFPLHGFDSSEALVPKAGGASIAEAFPQLLTFRVRTRNWWLLLVATFLCLVYCGWCARNITKSFLDDPIVIYFFLITTPLVLVYVVAWWKERRLLHIGKAILGFASISYGRWRYEFRMENGETRGGSCKIMFWNKNFPDNVTPVLLDPKNPDFSKPGLDFAFHKFVLIDRRHLPMQYSDAITTSVD